METLKELLVPSNACLLLAALGGLASSVQATRRFARWVVITAMLLLLLLASGWTATALLAPLEHAHAPDRQLERDPPAHAIVVLGAFGTPEPALPVSSWPNSAGLYRVVEAVHLRKRCHDCRIIVSGSTATVTAMAQVLVALGTPMNDVEIDGHADTTAASARNLADRLRRGPFYLVTSAGHMPRAMLAFRSGGLHPLPAPTDFRIRQSVTDANPLPSPKSLALSDLAVHEYLGIFWYQLQGM